MIMYGLLHLAPTEETAHNIKISGFSHQIEIYLKNAVTLSDSLKLRGIRFVLLTNNRDYLSAALEKLQRQLEIIQIPFNTNVPSGFKFFSAHFKIDALKYISLSENGYAILCDIDVICVSEMPLSLKNIIHKRTPVFYDISDQVISAYGHDVIIDDIEKIAGITAEGRWAGGEFIGGPPEFFEQLHQTIENIWPNYVLNAKSLHHIGDEAVISAALEIMTDAGQKISDAGVLGIIGRFWSCDIRHYQRPLAHYKNNFMLHLPADKRFLANIDSKNIPFFLKKYSSYLVARKASSLIKRSIKSVLSKLNRPRAFHKSTEAAV